jgi:hypothetical protein
MSDKKVYVNPDATQSLSSFAMTSESKGVSPEARAARHFVCDSSGRMVVPDNSNVDHTYRANDCRHFVLASDYNALARTVEELRKELDDRVTEVGHLRELYRTSLKERDSARAALDGVTTWLRASLKCEQHQWDSDQREAALECVAAADAALTTDTREMK